MVLREPAPRPDRAPHRRHRHLEPVEHGPHHDRRRPHRQPRHPDQRSRTSARLRPARWARSPGARSRRSPSRSPSYCSSGASSDPPPSSTASNATSDSASTDEPGRTLRSPLNACCREHVPVGSKAWAHIPPPAGRDHPHSAGSGRHRRRPSKLNDMGGRVSMTARHERVDTSRGHGLYGRSSSGLSAVAPWSSEPGSRWQAFAATHMPVLPANISCAAASDLNVFRSIDPPADIKMNEQTTAMGGTHTTPAGTDVAMHVRWVQPRATLPGE